MDIRFNKIIPRSLVDGPNIRTVVFLQGCSLACPGCQNFKLWNEKAGYLTTVHDLAQTIFNLTGSGGNVTISGGEPFQQAQSLAALVVELRGMGVGNILVYSGYTWEELHQVLHPDKQWINQALDHIDVLVDGRYIREKDDDYLVWRGSRNQRPIDVGMSLAIGQVVALDWENPNITITDDGNMIMPIGLIHEFIGMGSVQPSPMCGQVVRNKKRASESYANYSDRREWKRIDNG